MTRVDLAALPPPVFIDTDPAALSAAMVQSWETFSGRTLLPAQPERLFLDWMAYQLTLQRLAVQAAGEQVLVAYARGQNLDHLGALLGVERLAERPATALFRLTATSPAEVDRNFGPLAVSTGDGQWSFTDPSITLLAGRQTAEFYLSAATPGADANGLLAGQINRLSAPIAGVASVVNVSASYGGADMEGDDRFRGRIQEAPERFSTAGPTGAYRAWALSASQLVLDVAIAQPVPGRVRVTVLAIDGLPDAGLLAAVANSLSAEKQRPLTDTVEVEAAERLTYVVSAAIAIQAGADPATVMARATTAAAAYVADRRSGLARPVVPSQISAAIQNVAGVERVELAGLDLIAPQPHQWMDGAVGAITWIGG